MSSWVAFAVKGAAVLGTGSASGGFTLAITPSAVYGFAAGTLLTGMCFLIIVALRRAFRTVRPDYYASPGDMHSSVGLPADLPDPVDLHELDDMEAADSRDIEAELDLRTEEPIEPELPLEFGDPVVEMLAPAETEDDEDEADTDPYAAEVSATVPGPYEPSSYEPASYAPGPFVPDPFAEDPSMPDPYAAAEAFGSSRYDDDILFRGDDDVRHGGRGYHSKHRITAPDTMARRPEARRGQPRHAAPSARFSSRTSSREAPVPMVSARG